MSLEQEFIDTVLSLRDVPQSPKWHPEGDTLEHVKFIIYGLTFKEEMGIISAEDSTFLTWVALFHDLGKIDTLTFGDDGTPHAYGHANYVKDYIDKFREIIPDKIDIDRLKKICYYHMKAHQYMGTKMRVSKKEAFRDEFEPSEFHLLMTFESCDSAHTMYDMLRRTIEHVSVGYLEPVEFYDEIRERVPWNSDDIFVALIKALIKDK